jgi:hypothetical protein
MKCFMMLLENIHVSRLVEYPLKMVNVQGGQAPAKRQKILKKFENSSTRNCHRAIHELTDTAGISMEFVSRS